MRALGMLAPLEVLAKGKFSEDFPFASRWAAMPAETPRLPTQLCTLATDF